MQQHYRGRQDGRLLDNYTTELPGGLLSQTTRHFARNGAQNCNQEIAYESKHTINRIKVLCSSCTNPPCHHECNRLNSNCVQTHSSRSHKVQLTIRKDYNE